MTRLANNEAWEWPVDLYPLRDWLQAKGADVTAFKTDRQAFFIAHTLARQKMKIPPRGKPIFPSLLKLQRMLCQPGASPKRQPRTPRADPSAVHREHGLGTFGAASPVRRIDPSEYLQNRGAS